MSSTLGELCRHIQRCTERLEEEIKTNIEDSHKLLLSNEATEVKLALEKAKDYHYKEILDYLKEIVTNIRKVILHEGKIRSLKDEKGVSLDELRRYSHVQRQINAFSDTGQVTKRERRRVASDISIGSLGAWEQYLEKKGEEERAVQVETAEIQNRKRPNSKRRKKKFVSSTFNNCLDDRAGGKKLDSILEDSITEDDLKDTLSDEYVIINSDADLESYIEANKHDVRRSDSPLGKLLSDMDRISFGDHGREEDEVKEPSSDNYHDSCSVPNASESSEELHYRNPIDSKPKIVDVIYKKK